MGGNVVHIERNEFEMLNMSPVDIARRQQAQFDNGGGKSQYFSIADGETKYLRFLSSAETSYVVSHSCGATNIDMLAKSWEELEAAGQQPKCPQCGEPLTRENIVMERPSLWGAFMHKFVQTSDPNRKGNFVCLGHRENAMFGNVPTAPDGQTPLYQCPICAHPSNLNDKGKPKQPSYRLYGIAVEREVMMETKTINGIPTPTVVGVQDVMVTEDDGTTHPKVVIVEQGWKGFWSKVVARFPDPSQSICYYDWRVTRSGASLDTTYTVDPVNLESPNTVDLAQYMEYLPDIKGLLSGMGNPAYYVKNGWAVPGYVDEQQSAVQQAQAAVTQAAQPMAQPVQPVQPMQPMQPVATIGWDVAQGHINQ